MRGQPITQVENSHRGHDPEEEIMERPEEQAQPNVFFEGKEEDIGRVYLLARMCVSLYCKKTASTFRKL